MWAIAAIVDTHVKRMHELVALQSSAPDPESTVRQDAESASPAPDTPTGPPTSKTP